jgi:hypothetical protein
LEVGVKHSFIKSTFKSLSFCFNPDTILSLPVKHVFKQQASGPEGLDIKFKFVDLVLEF